MSARGTRRVPGAPALAPIALVLLWARAGAAVAQPPPEQRPPVVDVVVIAPPGEDAAALRRMVPAQPGQPLDVRVVRRSVQLLFASGRCANVLASTRPDGAGGVILVLDCVARDLVRSVRITDERSRSLPDENLLRGALALGPDDELWPGRLDQAVERVRELLVRRGFRHATVRAATAGQHQLAVDVVVTTGPATLVSRVDAGQLPEPVAARLLADLHTVPGAVLDLDALDEDVRTVRARLRQERYLRGRVGAPAITVEGDRARVDLAVEPGPRFDFRFLGTSYGPAELQEQLGLESEQVFDATAIDAATGRLRAFYRSQGHAEARVAVAEQSSAAAVAIVFTVEEGRRYRVGAVRFPGASRDPAWLRARLDEALPMVSDPAPPSPTADAERLAKASGSTPALRARAGAEPTEVWNPPVWERAMQRLVELYRDEGYLDATHERTRAILDARTGTVDVELQIREGVQTRVASVVLEGNLAVPTADLQKELRIEAGQPLAYAAVDASRAALLTAYARRGYSYARITDAEEIAPDRKAAVVRFRIEEGPQVRVGKLVVTGARRTREDVIRDALAIRPGDVYDPDAVMRSQAALLRLGVFRSVGLRLSEADLPEQTKDVTVEVAERPWRTLAPGLGFSLANGPRVFVELTQPNLYGRALELVARAKVNYPLSTFTGRTDLDQKPFFDRLEGRGDVGLHDPRVRLFGTQVRARVDGIVERLHRRAYDLGRASTVFGLDVPVGSHVTVSLQYELEFDHIAKSAALTGVALTRADVERLRFPEGFTTLQSIRPVVVIDFRDNALHPRRGVLASSTLDWVHSIGGANDSYLFGLIQGSDSYTHMLKLSVGITGYVPITQQSVLAVSLRGGRVFPLDPTSQTIGPKRFFLGGASTMRGYEEDEVIPQDARDLYVAQVRSCATSISGNGCTAAAQQIAAGQTLVSGGGEAFVLAKVELRVPLRGNVEAGLFTDVGNLWVDPAQMNLRELRVNVGFGLRFASPIGPAVVDLGFNVNPDQRLGERVVAPHFSIGFF